MCISLQTDADYFLPIQCVWYNQNMFKLLKVVFKIK